jgi:hypothetical protein
MIDMTKLITAEMKFDEAVANALARLWLHHDSLIAGQGLVSGAKQAKDNAKINKALRKEAKGNAGLEDVKLLDNNDTIDDWLDAIESDAEGQGETWIEDPLRTIEELEAFDPATDIVWTDAPELEL